MFPEKFMKIIQNNQTLSGVYTRYKVDDDSTQIGIEFKRIHVVMDLSPESSTEFMFRAPPF